MKRVAIVQARMGSTRLPCKVLMEIAGQPMLGWVIERVRQANAVDEVVVATTTADEDAPIAALCERIGVRCFRGSRDDVLDRYYQAARQVQADAIIRITADCPLIDPDVIDAVIAGYEAGSFDYVSNIDPPTYPDGLDTELFSWAALQRAWKEAALPSEREHVTPYLRNHSEIFRSANILHNSDLSGLRWTVDAFDDLAFIRAVAGAFTDNRFRLQDVCELLRRDPLLSAINAGHTRNEGYIRSVQAEASDRLTSRAA